LTREGIDASQAIHCRAVGIAALAALAAPAAAQTVVKIGVINSNSGFLAQPGDEMEKGMALYVKSTRKTCRPASRSSSSGATTPPRPRPASGWRRS